MTEFTIMHVAIGLGTYTEPTEFAQGEVTIGPFSFTVSAEADGSVTRHHVPAKPTDSALTVLLRRPRPAEVRPSR